FATSLTADVTSAANILSTGALAAVGSARRDAIEMDIPFKTNVVDVVSFVNQLAAVTSSGVTGGISNATIIAGSALNSAITGAYATAAAIGSHYTGAGGLGIYFPRNAGVFASTYAATSAALTSSTPGWLL